MVNSNCTPILDIDMNILQAAKLNKAQVASADAARLPDLIDGSQIGQAMKIDLHRG